MHAARLSPEQELATYERGRNDPRWWVQNVLGDVPWETQVEVFESVRDHTSTAVKSCHSAGKSWLAARLGLWFLYTHVPSIVITTAPTDRQVKGILWKEIRVAHRLAQMPLGGEPLTQELKLADDWWAVGFTAPNYDSSRFQGYHSPHILVIVDEACGVSRDIYEAIDSILASGHARKLEIGNPTDPTTPFAAQFREAGPSKFTIDAFQTPNFTAFGIGPGDIESGGWEKKIGEAGLPAPHLISPAWVAQKFRECGPESPYYKARVLAEFPESGDDTLIPLSWIEAAQRREIEPTRETTKVLGADIARYGSDETVVMCNHGGRVRAVYKGHHNDTMKTTGNVVRTLRETGARIAHVDADGLGAGVADRMAELNEPVEAMHAGSKPHDTERFLNSRAEWYWTLREMFERGTIDIDPGDEDLAAQLASLKWKITSAGKVQIESKDDMRRRGLSSPDRADAVAMACAPEADPLRFW